MGLVQTPPTPLVLPTRRTVIFTSSTTWTVPTTCIYADVFVVGGGGAGAGGYRTTSSGNYGGGGGGMTYTQNIYLGGTGTVAITVGAGATGGVGTATTSQSSVSQAGFSAFGTFVYSQGGFNTTGGQPHYKGTVQGQGNVYKLRNDTNQSNYSNVMAPSIYNAANNFYGDTNSVTTSSGGFNVNTWGVQGGGSGSGSTTPQYRAGGAPGPNSPDNSGNIATEIITNTLSQNFPSLWTASIGTATAGTAGTGGGAGGAAGIAGFAGGGGAHGPDLNAAGQGGPGAGGAGSRGSSNNGGAGGNAGANTGGGGGCGGNTGSTSAGTGGNGGNGGSGIVIVTYLGTN
jgi:hypothetical protein